MITMFTPFEMKYVDPEGKEITEERIRMELKNETHQHIINHYQQLSQWDERKLNQLFNCNTNVYKRVDNVGAR